MINYRWGFSLKGFIIFLLPMIPNLLYFLMPELYITSENAVNSHVLLDVLEHGSQLIFICMIIFIIRKQVYNNICSYTVGMAIILLLYYGFWFSYFIGKSSLIILLAMAILPVIYFILAEIWLNNYLAIIPTIIFGIVHVIVTYMDFS